MTSMVTARTVTSARTLLRTAAGPLALTGFFLPWAHGPGLLAATEFTGFTLVGFAGRLQALELPLLASGTLLFVRLLILGIAIAALWLTLLAPRHTWHLAYSASGWYLATTAALALLLGLLKSGPTIPPLGLAFWFLGALAFLLSRRRPPAADS